MPSYADIKGQPVRQANAPAAGRPVVGLSDAERERVAANRAFVLEHMPELVDFIKALHAEGMIDGWRAVGNCATTKEL